MLQAAAALARPVGARRRFTLQPILHGRGQQEHQEKTHDRNDYRHPQAQYYWVHPLTADSR
jgi:hypothetical protein